MTKPIYKVPTMEQIQQIPHNGFHVVSTFSGGGGSCLGYRMAGYKVIWANEFIEEAQKTYKANHPNSYLDTRDIRQVQPEDILKQTGLKKGEIDIFDGSPPCAAFSTSGKREAGWGVVKKYSDSQQRVDDLFFEYIRLLEGLQPKVFIAENVKGLISGSAKGYFKQILKELKAAGYNVKVKLLNSLYLGVPQARERIIFIGVRNDLPFEPCFPKPKPYTYSFYDGVRSLVNINDSQCYNLTGKTLRLWSLSKKFKGNMAKTSEHHIGKSGYFNHRRLTWEKHTPTIVQGSTVIYHPDEPRTLNISELKRISSFPDDFILTGSFSKKWERVGRSVPPFMMKEISKTVEGEILCKITV